MSHILALVANTYHIMLIEVEIAIHEECILKPVCFCGRPSPPLYGLVASTL